MSSLAWLAQPELFDGAAFVGPGGFGGAPSATFPGMRAMGERLALDDASLRGALAGDFDPAAQNAAQVLGTLRKHMAAMVCNRAVALAHARDALANVRAASLPVDLAARWNRSTDLPALLRANAERLPLARVHATWGDEDVCVLGTLDERVAQFRGVLGGANVSVLRGAGHCAMVRIAPRACVCVCVSASSLTARRAVGRAGRDRRLASGRRAARVCVVPVQLL